MDMPPGSAGEHRKMQEAVSAKLARQLAAEKRQSGLWEQQCREAEAQVRRQGHAMAGMEKEIARAERANACFRSALARSALAISFCALVLLVSATCLQHGLWWGAVGFGAGLYLFLES